MFSKKENDMADAESARFDDAKEAAIEQMPDEELLYDLADLFKVFADTTRIKILYALMGQDLSVGDIAEVVGVSQSAVSYTHLTLPTILRV